MLVQILEDGYLTDAKGRKVDFRNTIIIMTSNVGASEMFKEAQLGFRAASRDERKELEQTHDKMKDRVMEDMKKSFRPEFLNRIDQIIVFRALSQPDIKRILGLQLADLSKRLKEQNLTLKVTASAKAYLIEKGYNVEQGARPMRRAIQDYLEDPLAHGLLSLEFKTGDTVVVNRRGDKLHLQAESAQAAESESAEEPATA
jgi:ATP-dependent Clp protease ATP-binding subunit ClpC